MRHHEGCEETAQCEEHQGQDEDEGLIKPAGVSAETSSSAQAQIREQGADTEVMCECALMRIAA